MEETPPPLEAASNPTETPSLKHALSTTENHHVSPSIPPDSLHTENPDLPQEPIAKKVKLTEEFQERKKGVAPIAKEYLISISDLARAAEPPANGEPPDAPPKRVDYRDERPASRKKGKAQKANQNGPRTFGQWKDEIELCTTRMKSPEFSPLECPFGDKCRFEHNLRKYLKEGKRKDLTSFNGVCPVWEARGVCFVGWKCRFLASHMEERTTATGEKELVLTTNDKLVSTAGTGDNSRDIVNQVSGKQKNELMKRIIKTPKSDEYLKWMEKVSGELSVHFNSGSGEDQENVEKPVTAAPEEVKDDTHNGNVDGEAKDTKGDAAAKELKLENRAQYTEPPFLPSEKRRLYFGPETPVLAPLTTQGNLPFRRLCIDLGAQVTYSEMAMSQTILQGNTAEWALMKAHISETLPPKFTHKGSVVQGYDHSKDLRFGAQIAGNKPWQVMRSTEVISALCPHLRVIDLNCGCPIEMVFRKGSGAGLLDNHAKLEKMVRGMNVVSGEIPISVKIRMGTKDNKPTATKLAQRLLYGGVEAHELGQASSGVAAITLHGRSRAQRYTRSADWQYIAECATLIKQLNLTADSLADTIREVDARTQPNSGNSHVYFLGNGDCYSHEDYNSHITDAKVDSVMIARGALVKPWIFEEIEAQQYLDKSASERLSYVEKFVKYGLDTWGSDEIGIGHTRKFLLEWLCFAHRYVPVGLLEHLPPKLQDRPPAYFGRNELETLLASENYRDWIKISDMFLGPAHKDFRFEPKHQSNSYEIEAEG
ncbi:MAG: tRNA-dihydrouridine synthase 3 [Trizodia sp. TS-e1964]|nr:MAG: tRNA-dihydrouridine synthase 3 [Trizodia sp. TS-e1964]